MRIRKDTKVHSEESEIIAKASDALAHPLRVEIFRYIYKENLERRFPCTKELVEKFGYSQSTISQHMNVFTISGLLKVQKQNSFSHYSVNIGMLGKYLDAIKKLNQQVKGLRKMKKPVLVIMAAGMGSRYGSLKQMDPIGPAGELIIDYSIYDAKRAGFEKVVCIIKHEIEKDFIEIMNRGAAKHMDIEYVFQDINKIPDGFKIPEGRVKPWGTGHAILAAKDVVDGPFVVINADDYYGPQVFKDHFDYLMAHQDDEFFEYCMGGYYIENTLLPQGSVTRGVCITKDGYLSHIDERKTIQKNGDKIQFTLDDGNSWTTIPEGTNVSMNFFGFTNSIFKELEARFPAALEEILRENPLKGEYYIPIVTSDLVNEKKARVKILPTPDKWFGVTNKEDRELMVNAMKEKTANGEYPEKLWE